MSLSESSELFSWLEVAEGPLLLLSQKLVPHWYGCLSRCDGSQDADISTPEGSFYLDPRNLKDPMKTHYGQACQLKTRQGLIPVDNGVGLILRNAEPAQSVTWWPDDVSGGMIVRVQRGSRETDIREALENLSYVAPDWRDELTWEVRSDRFILFEASLMGVQIERERSLLIFLAPGVYKVQATEYQAFGGEVALSLHRFQWQGKNLPLNS